MCRIHRWRKECWFCDFCLIALAFGHVLVVVLLLLLGTPTCSTPLPSKTSLYTSCTVDATGGRGCRRRNGGGGGGRIPLRWISPPKLDRLFEEHQIIAPTPINTKTRITVLMTGTIHERAPNTIVTSVQKMKRLQRRIRR
jgi:hypothetical protein